MRKWRGKRGHSMRVLTWNLFHGRAVPDRPGLARWTPSPRALAAWDWDVALLQEVPPWWGAAARARDAARARARR